MYKASKPTVHLQELISKKQSGRWAQDMHQNCSTVTFPVKSKHWRKPKCSLLVQKQIFLSWYVHAMEQQAAIKKNERLCLYW